MIPLLGIIVTLR